MLATCRVQSGYARQVLDGLELAGRFLEVLERLALGVDGVDRAVRERRFEGTEGQVALVVPLEPQLRGVLHRVEHGRVVVPVVRVGELHDLDVVHGHPVHPEHQLDALVLLDAPPVVLDRVQALGEPDLLPLELGHPVDVVPRPHQHAAALVRSVGGSQELGAADVGVDVDGREQTAEADEVVQVVDVVRVPVVLTDGAKERVLDADLLVLLPGPTQLLVDVAGRHQRAVRVVHLVPAQRNGAGFLLLSHG